MARIPSVVQAIQPRPRSSSSSESSLIIASGCNEARRSSSRRGMSWTPMLKNGRRRCDGALGLTRLETARGMLEITDRS